MVVAYLNVPGECNKHKIHIEYIISGNSIIKYLIHEVR